MSNVATIMWLTFHEARRRKMVLAALVLGLLFIVLYVVGFLFIVYEAKLIVTGVTEENGVLSQNAELLQRGQDLGLNFLTMAGLYVVHFLTIMLAIFASVDTVAGEISSHTIQAIATTPVRRWEIIIGKWLGQTAMIVPYLVLLSVGITGSIYLITGYWPGNVVEVVGLIVLQAMVLLSLSLLGGTRLSTLTNGVGLFMLYGLAFIGSWIEQIGYVLGSKAAVNIGIATSLVMPVEALWRLAANLLSPSLFSLDKRLSMLFGAASVPNSAMVLYAIAYAAVVLGLAVRAFSRRDL
ncbi:MAG TPA: ABC transporter permease subunit [Chloroflexia bacterium]|nr:ABC transporter permease subunit [Chloroflexia bacterium]